ncbi:MAG: glycoside hydrolase family 43 protein [Acidimicrobiales bacterium]
MTSEVYTNPIIAGFNPDPSVCRVGDDYYLVTSTFEYFPGVPLYHSRDLVHWRHLTNVLDRPEQLSLERAPSSGGIFAPTLRHHDGHFHMVTTNFWDRGNFVVTATDPAGPWSDPVPLEVPGIDPDLAWDDDGCIVTTSGIAQTRVDLATGRPLAEPGTTWSGTGLQHPEAPHLYRRGDWWYLLIAEGGTERGHGVSIARSRQPDGPFEGCPSNPILSHRSTDRPIQNTGHADLVELPDGSWWMVLLGVRPRGMTPAYHVLGRETFLAPVRWDHNWPVVDPIEPEYRTGPLPAAPWPDEPVRDDFGGDALHPRWLSVRRRRDQDWSLTDRPGWLTLHGGEHDMDQPLPVFVGRRQQHQQVAASVRMAVDGAARAGLSVRMDERHHFDVVIEDGHAVARYRVGDLLGEVGRTPVAGEAELGVRIDEPPPDFGMPPDRITAIVDGEPIATVDGRYLSTGVASGFTGRVIGMFAVDGTAHFDWFDYTGTDFQEDA